MSENNKEEKNSKIFDKVIMGAVIGGAIGSVLGATIAPKEGKKTREEIKDAAIHAKDGTIKLFSKIKNIFRFFKKKKDQTVSTKATTADMKKIPHETLPEKINES